MKYETLYDARTGVQIHPGDYVSVPYGLHGRTKIRGIVEVSTRTMVGNPHDKVWTLVVRDESDGKLYNTTSKARLLRKPTRFNGGGAGTSIVLRVQRRGRPEPATTNLPTYEAAIRYVNLHGLLTDRSVILVQIQHLENGEPIKIETIKGGERIAKLRHDLMKLRQYQERAVGALNKSEFVEEIEWTELEIARREGRKYLGRSDDEHEI